MPEWNTEGWNVPDPDRLATALRLIRMLCHPGSSVADLGCLHGAYSIAFAKAGYLATGIEARPENIEACIQNSAGVPGVKFIQGDVRNVAGYGSFDAVFCCGLLYHLDEPVKFLGILGKITSRVLILDTHFAVRADAVHEGRDGWWYQEEGEDNPWASWGNSRSFWLAKPDLLAAVQGAGFSQVLECHDQLAGASRAPSRTMIAAVKDPG